MNNNINIEIDWRGLIPSLLWSWIIAWIPSMYIAVLIYMTSYKIENGMLTYKSGIISRKYRNIDLYRIKNLSAEDNLISGGKLFITDTNGTPITLPYVKNAGSVANQLRTLVNNERENKHVNAQEIMM